jgi:hypothetical protein
MTSLLGVNILIIDFPGAYQLRASLMRAGAHVHVVTAGGARILARTKHIDAAFVDLGADAATLSGELAELGIGRIILAGGDGISECLERQSAMLAENSPADPICAEA